MKPVCPPLPPIPEGMDWEKFRADGHRVIDFIADYHQSLKKRAIPVAPQVEPGYLKKAITATVAPQKPSMSFTEVLDNISAHIVPGMTHWQHPDFYAWFPSMLSPPALLGDTVASAFNQPGFNWMASPAAAELEMIVTDWVARALGLPESMTWGSTGGGVLQPTASEAAAVALLAAKNRTLSRYATTEEKSAAAAKLVCYVSDQAHFCVEKASRILSIWHVRRIKTRRLPGGNCPMNGEDLAAAVQADIEAGLIPCVVSVNYGTTGICAIDDFEGCARVCKEHRIWLNLDAAYAGATALCPEMRDPILPAFTHADSLFINGSKWFSLITNVSFFFFKERSHIVSSLNATGVYLENKHSASNTVVDFKDYHLGMGRPFRALKVYTTLQCMGVEGIQASIRRHCTLASYLHSLLAANYSDIFELPIDAKFGLVCFRIKEDNPSNQRNHALLELLQKEGRIMLVHCELDGKILVRVALAYPGLDEKDMEELADYIAAKGKQVIDTSAISA